VLNDSFDFVFLAETRRSGCAMGTFLILPIDRLWCGRRTLSMTHARDLQRIVAVTQEGCMSFAILPHSQETTV
jgi:hypothetical protein